MLTRLSIAEFLGCLIKHIEEKTGLPCYDNPINKTSPLYSVQITKTEPQDTKTRYVDRYDVWIHCISEPTETQSTAPVLELVQKLEEAMTIDVVIPQHFQLLRQVYGGLQTLKVDESNEGHAVLSFSFSICYGFRCK